jgi:putative ubiquitin-RnfH superfamily antitoxin RatB of RatAB toxin-antitoxin module
MANEATIDVQVVVSLQARACQEVELNLATGSTLADAVRASQLLHTLSNAQVDTLQTGIWGVRTQPDQRLREGDRVELYRPLTVDPKVARRERFERQGARGTGLFAKRRAGAKSGY